MAVYFGMLDALLETEELPEEYRDQKQARAASFLLKISVPSLRMLLVQGSWRHFGP